MMVLFASCWACVLAPCYVLHIQVFIIRHTITLSLAHFVLPTPSTASTDIIKSICYCSPCHSQLACSHLSCAGLQQGEDNAPAATESPSPDKLNRTNHTSPQKVRDTANSKARNGPTFDTIVMMDRPCRTLLQDCQPMQTNQCEHFCRQRLAFRQRMGIA
jgi:hypothetical protein